MRILYLQYADPALYPPLEHSSRIFAEHGASILFLGIGAWGAPGIQLPPNPSITVRLLPFCPPGFRQKLHYLAFCLWVLTYVLAWRPRWVYVSDPLACPAARLLKMFPRVKLLYHEHDSPGQTRANAIIMRSRQIVARGARLNVLPNQFRAEEFQSETGTSRPIRCVWNCPRREEIGPPRSASPAADLWVLYHGSLVPDRLPLSVLTALASLPAAVKLRVIGYETFGSEGYCAELREQANRLGVLDRVELLNSMPRARLLDYGRESSIGLSFMPMGTHDINMRAMTGASNKAFDYLACGLALLVSDLPDWRSLFVDPGYGLACNPNDSASIANALRGFLNDPAEMRAMGERGRQRIASDWNYETQFAPVYEAINNAP